MKRLINVMLASLFIFAVLVSVPAYTDYVGNPVFVENTQGPAAPNVMGSWQ
jgi:hypothetical protein